MKDPIDSCSVSISNLEIRVMFGFRIHWGKGLEMQTKVRQITRFFSPGLKLIEHVFFQYNHLYQNLKQYSKNGDNYLKELQTVFQQR